MTDKFDALMLAAKTVCIIRGDHAGYWEGSGPNINELLSAIDEMEKAIDAHYMPDGNQESKPG